MSTEIKIGDEWEDVSRYTLTDADYVEGRKQARIHGVPDDGGQQFAAGWARAAQHFAAENARLRQRAEKAEAERDEARADRMAAVLRVSAVGHDSIARVVVERDQLRDERDRLQARLDTATAHIEELRGQRDEARAAKQQIVEAHNQTGSWR